MNYFLRFKTDHVRHKGEVGGEWTKEFIFNVEKKGQMIACYHSDKIVFCTITYYGTYNSYTVN